MSESLATRISRIISGSLNAVVDSIENAAPEMLMEQVLREIDGAIDDVRVELGRVAAGRHLATSRLTEENRRHQTLAEQIETAVSQGRDDLAEAGIAEQLDIEVQVPVLERTIAEAGDKEKELEGYIQALQARKRELRTELQRFAESRRDTAAAPGSAGASEEGKGGAGIAERVARAESAFDRVLEKQTGLSSRGGGGIAQGAKLAELEELARNNRIRERLAALKSRSGDG